ncbi:MAG: Grx4 family monothiol glutaredoxin [Holophagae bacterium]|jgi:monothiol glutaredoxin
MSDSNPFHITGGSPEPRRSGAPVGAGDSAAPALDRVEKMIQSSDVFLFMKGVPEQPLCGFSANAVAMLESLGAPYVTFDVLADEAIRQAAKEYAQWPTFPQLWIKGELVGGHDIMLEMARTGELQQQLRSVAS